MMLSAILPAILALSRVVAGHLAADVDQRAESHLEERGWHDDNIVEHVIFKRGDVLSPRDLENAKRNNVDINEMYKHSVFKRSEGDDYVIWVHNAFNETTADDEDPDELHARDLSKRQKSRPVGPNWNNGAEWWCTHHGEVDTTHANAPTTGGANAIIAWAERVSGRFNLPANCCKDPKKVNLVIGGSNGGTNIRFGAGLHPNDAMFGTLVGSRDIGDNTRRARDRFQKQYNGQWKVQAHGFMRCNIANGVIRPFHPGQYVTWVLHHSNMIV